MGCNYLDRSYYKIGFRVIEILEEKEMVITNENLIGFNWIATTKMSLRIRLVGFRVSEILKEIIMIVKTRDIHYCDSYISSLE